jgi:hypothetical protein
MNRPLTIGDQLYADDGAQAEIHLPATAFRLGSRTAFEFMNLDDRSTQVRLSEGSLDVRVRRLKAYLEIDTPNLAFTISQPGEYRFDTDPDKQQTYVTVRDGEGQVTGNAGSFEIRAGQQGVVSGQDQSAQYNVYAAPAYDSFDNWVLSRNRDDDRYSASRYVSPDVVGYEDLNQYGSWRQVPDYGEIWVPGNVAAGWAPYQEGRWSWVDPWGWTWVDDAPWGFAPFHYGRWAHVNGFWGWCPGPVAVAPVYAPALVAWVGFGGLGISVGVGGGDSVGWFPLGPRDVYIPSYRASQSYVTRVNVSNTVINNVNVTNVYNNYVRTGSVPVTSYANRSVPGAVVAVPQNALVNSQPVRQAAIHIQPNQINAVKTVSAAPRVAPQMASMLGRPATGGNVARPPAAVMNRAVVAKATPPPPPASFQQRQALMNKNPGQPLAIQQQQQLARSAPAAAVHAPVQVVAQARPVTPQVVNTPAPRNMPSQAQPPRAATQPPARTPLPTPPATQAQPQPSRTLPPPRTQTGVPAAQPNRPYAPPSAQRQQIPPAAQPPATPRQPLQVPPTAQPQPRVPPAVPVQRPQAPSTVTRPPTQSREQIPRPPVTQPQPPRPAQQSRPYQPPTSTPHNPPAAPAPPVQQRQQLPHAPAAQPPPTAQRQPPGPPPQREQPAPRAQQQPANTPPHPQARPAAPATGQADRTAPERKKTQ